MKKYHKGKEWLIIGYDNYRYFFFSYNHKFNEFLFQIINSILNCCVMGT